MRSPDFLDAEKYASITFKSDGIDAVNETDFEVTGLLTIHGVTKQVHFGVHVAGTGKDPWGNNRIAYSASLRINREDLGIPGIKLETGGDPRRVALAGYFLTHAMHQPFGLIFPVTTLQPLGALKSLQPEHFW